MAENIKLQVISKVKISPFFSIQLDESRDMSSSAQLLCCVRFVNERKLLKKMLFCKEVVSRATGESLFEIVNEFIRKEGLNWDKCVGLCTNAAAAAMTESIQVYSSELKIKLSIQNVFIASFIEKL
jgi:hypothetical protein